MSDTELRLVAWRDGATQAERLAAAILSISGYTDIDPQAPLGGPDSRRDITCIKGGRRWIGAVYFPSIPGRYSAVKRKFLHDLEGTINHDYDGLIFITNQSISVSQRAALLKLGADRGKEIDIISFGAHTRHLRLPYRLWCPHSVLANCYEYRRAAFMVFGVRKPLRLGIRS
jgi:hypothetical protein